jgi:transcriptional regulator with XRE-family HTH domain
MLKESVVQEIMRLLAEGRLSQRKIARVVGVSRGTVCAIARGKRLDRKARRNEKEAEERPLGPPERCPGCGGLVHLPCRACRLRKRLAQSPPPRLPDRANGSLIHLELREEHRRRYEQLRMRRLMRKRRTKPEPSSGETTDAKS